MKASNVTLVGAVLDLVVVVYSGGDICLLLFVTCLLLKLPFRYSPIVIPDRYNFETAWSLLLSARVSYLFSREATFPAVCLINHMRSSVIGGMAVSHYLCDLLVWNLITLHL